MTSDTGSRERMLDRLADGRAWSRVDLSGGTEAGHATLRRLVADGLATRLRVGWYCKPGREVDALTDMAERRVGTAADRIAAALGDGREWTSPALFASAGVSVGGGTNALNWLVVNGRARKVSRGVYRLDGRSGPRNARRGRVAGGFAAFRVGR